MIHNKFHLICPGCQAQFSLAVLNSGLKHHLFHFMTCVSGFLLAILEKTGVISPNYSEEGEEVLGVGTVAAGYQNFLICIEMIFAAIALRWVC